MLQEINDSEIEYAEKILFGSTGKFDQERLDFIKCLKSVDLQAVPGSGKTTVLLAKLLILEKRLPLENGAGILIISHTNVAVDEIRNRIGRYCPKLFTYPNFVGTIQSFVNQFLAIPFFENYFKKRLIRIDNEVYNEELERAMTLCVKDQKFETFNKVKYIYNVKPAVIFDYRFDLDSQSKTHLVGHINGPELIIKKPLGKTKPANYVDYTADEKVAVMEYLTALKSQCLTRGTLHYDDAYYLAKLYLHKKPDLVKYLRLRFPFVFVDEMQDMERHQHDLLENIFHDPTQNGNCYQRVGDINQCIFTENSSSLESIWVERANSLTISGSHRLTPAIASIVQNFGAQRRVPIIGLNKGPNLSPYIILFKQESIKNVLTTFGDLVLKYQAEGILPNVLSPPIRIIGWNGKEPEVGKLRISDYFKPYLKEAAKQKIDYSNFLSYLVHYDKEKMTLEAIRKNILNAILRIIRIERLEHNGRYFTKRTFLSYLRQFKPEHMSDFKDFLYYCCINIIRGETDGVHQRINVYLPGLFQSVFDIKLSSESLRFLSDKSLMVTPMDKIAEPLNILCHDTLKFKVGPVHSVKGETHLATLYLETCYYDHESEKSLNQLIGKCASVETKVRKQESAKMMYVGLSRATHLLCFAALESRLQNQESALEKAGWKIIKI
ncbi:UvrD-helicase domain-containing protein [Mucilaginibacter sp. BJC16-A38]|uniref:UvrD-helicase domain-containing protein n=1 Tax=Mucilaginibacter phenanthrenivorans TaxID=1234842 RepID=UPI002157B2D2|nr:UvrD-helicase domain-containing protein [Mucilaginibacter phenanthrenivorans]MCR8557011.1 UvrD-helicase domain-containing protein [Mucilaginibacter phenanthrenivorans]